MNSGYGLADEWQRCYIGIGSNMGDKKNNINLAVQALRDSDSISVKQVSSMYLTEPLGYIEQEEFLNCVVEIMTVLQPGELLHHIQAIENRMKRIRTIRDGPRIIDLDILFYDDLVINSQSLVIPHPRAHLRKFVLLPLYTIAPQFMHPLSNKNVFEMLQDVEKSDEQKVIPYNKHADEPIHLINVVRELYWNDRENLELELAGSILALHGYRSQLHNISFGINSLQEMHTAIGSAKVVVFHIDFNADDEIMDYIYGLSARMKDHAPLLTIIIFGDRASRNYMDILNECASIDFILIGDHHEQNLIQILDQPDGHPSNLDIPGIAFRQNASVIMKKPRAANVDTLWALRDEELIKNTGFAKIRTSRGCLGNCSFCIDVGYEREWRGRDTEQTLDELEYIVNRYDVRRFSFLDNSFEDPGNKGKERMLSFISGLKERNLKIYYNCSIRAESFQKNEEASIRMLSGSGLYNVLIGLESGYQEHLRLFNKRATVQDNLSICEMVNRSSINILPGFMMFHPYSSLLSLQENAEFLNRIHKSYSFTSFCSAMKIFPGVRMAEKLKEDNLIVDSDSKSMILYKFLAADAGKMSDALCRIRYSSEAVKLGLSIDNAKNLLAMVRKNYTDWKGEKELAQYIEVSAEEFGYSVQGFFKECLEMAGGQWNEDSFAVLLQALEQKAQAYDISGSIKRFMKMNIRNPELNYLL